jgi:hypothetical protein
MINQLTGTHCIIVDERNQVHYSANIERVRYFKNLVR